jgi:hypothetical protein
MFLLANALVADGLGQFVVEPGNFHVFGKHLTTPKYGLGGPGRRDWKSAIG